ncbi:MAG: oxygen-independent coproporphyrinogen III oxidase [Bacteriovoracia bacterium]
MNRPSHAATPLLKKYNVPGPRYTSYPTVPYWETNPTPEQWIGHLSSALSTAKQEKQGGALYLHIPFCERLCTYCGCNTRITRNHGVSQPYTKTLLKEWATYRERLGISTYPLAELHLGGGTPTFYTPEELKELLEGLFATCERATHSEFSIEADPRVTNPDHLRVLSGLGFTRLSLGIQDFDPKVQEIVNRVQSVEQVEALTKEAREKGFQSINYDLIYGLPFQTRDSVRNTIETVIRLRPDRIAFYAYAHVPWIKASQRRFTEADLPDGDEKRALYELGRAMLEEAGYREIGMDHFALESDALWQATQSGRLHRNFMGYIPQQVSPLIGLGVSAIGDSTTAFAQNEKLLEKYTQRVESGEVPLIRGHLLTEEDLVIRRHILNLMTRFETRWEQSAQYTPYLESVPGRLAELLSDGLVEIDGKTCRITESGRPYLRNICMAFDARLTAKAPGTQLFSKTI